MTELDNGKDKIQQICDVLRRNTLEPAQQQAREIVENSHLQAEEVLKEAREKADRILEKAADQIQQKEKSFQSSLSLAMRQGIERLKQAIEQELFQKSLSNLVGRELREDSLIAQVINQFVKSLDERGIEEDISAIVANSFSARELNEKLLEHVRDRLKEKGVVLGDFSGGVQLKLRDQQITIDISEEAVKELLSEYIRADFRSLIFQP